MILNGIFGALAILSFILMLWQWLAARRFPLHQRSADLRIGANRSDSQSNAPDRSSAFQPPVTLLKPIKGCDEYTEACLRSWFEQDYPGEIQILFAVAEANDPAGAVIEKLRREFPRCDARLIVCPERLGANAKVSKLAQLEAHAKHEVIVISDADVKVPPDLLANAVLPLRDESVGLVNCFYQLANPATLAMLLEAVAVNADFWSQVLQSQSLRPLDFALGAVMVTRRKQLAEIGGFRALADCLADDYQLGHRIAKRGHRIELCPVVVECWDPPMGWRAVWRHQVRWARTIRVCQPLPYFFSILSNATLWPWLWALVSLPALGWHRNGVGPDGAQYLVLTIPLAVPFALVCLVSRVLTADNLQRKLSPTHPRLKAFWLVPVKDLWHTALWFCAFAGNTIEWRGERYRLRRDGNLEKESSS